MAYTYYGTISEANDYFDNRLHEEAWYGAVVLDRERALIKARQIIDNLNFKGLKHSTYLVVYDTDGELIADVTDAEIRAAEASQDMEFPRDADTLIPAQIKFAQWEVAHALLDGIDPDLELENLGIVSQGMASVRTTYNRNHTQIEHLMNGVPSAAAWRYLRPFLRDGDAIKLSRVD